MPGIKERGFQPELNFKMREADPEYDAILTIPCHDGVVELDQDQLSGEEISPEELADAIESEVERRGGQV